MILLNALRFELLRINQQFKSEFSEKMNENF